MSAAPQVAKARAAPDVEARPLAIRPSANVPRLARPLSARWRDEWVPRAVWTISRTGRLGLAGIALLLGAAVFLLSTHLRVVSEVDAMRAELAVAHGRARIPEAVQVAPVASATLELPERADLPAILSQLFNEAREAGLALDTAKYETTVMKTSGVVRNQIVFPLIGPYPQIRAFIDTTLATMPTIAISDLVLTRSSIAHGNVEAQIRMSIYTRSAP